MKKLLLKSVLWCFALVVLAAPGDEMFRDDRPDSYTVRAGDTLWDIAAKFLKSPWRWPEVWKANKNIDNPDKIYPGDVIGLINDNGKSSLMISRDGNLQKKRRTIKISPKVRKRSLVDPIPTVSMEMLSVFLSKARIVSDPEMLDQAPYVISGESDRNLSSLGDRIYVRGVLKEGVSSMGVYRKNKEIIDPETNELLGVLALKVGSVALKHVDGDLLTFEITQSLGEILSGDRLLTSEKREIGLSFMLGVQRVGKMEARIVDVIKGVRFIGLFDNVIINKGERDKVVPGNFMNIYESVVLTDRFSGKEIVMPSGDIGLLMIYRVFEKLSYGVVLKADKPIKTGSLLKTPSLLLKTPSL